MVEQKLMKIANIKSYTIVKLIILPFAEKNFAGWIIKVKL
jgi:hypothetical protein